MIVSASVGTTSHTTCSTTSRDRDSTASTCALFRPKPPSFPAKSAGNGAGAACGLLAALGLEAGAAAATGAAFGDEPTSIEGALAFGGRMAAIGCAGSTGDGSGAAEGMTGLGPEP